MKKEYSILLLLMLFSAIGFAQKETKFYWNEKWETVTKKESPSYFSLIVIDENYNPLSDIKTYYITGELYSNASIIDFNRYNLKNCILKGIVKNYYKNGNIKSEAQYTNEGKENGLFKFYYENGKTKQIDSYLNGLPHGEVIVYYENGKTKQIVNYLNGLLHGELISYYENEKIKFTNYYKNGKANGIQVEYYPNGNKSRVAYFIDNILNGLIQEFYENGKLKIEANYLNGNLHGKYIEYDENGNKKVEKNYNNGNLEYRTDGIYIFNCKNLCQFKPSTKERLPNTGKNYLAIQFKSDGSQILYYNNSWNFFFAFEDKKYLINNIIEFMNNKKSGMIKNTFKSILGENSFVSTHLAERTDYTSKHSFKVFGEQVQYNYDKFTSSKYNDYIILNNETSIDDLEFIPLYELSSEGLAAKQKVEEEQAKILKVKQEEEQKKYQLKKEAEAKQAILFEENRKTKLKNLQVGDRVSWSQGWKNTDKFFGFTFSETNYNMNVICYIENVSGDRYQIRVANIKSTSSSNWEYPELNGVPLKEGTLHWIKPSDYINDKSWHYIE
jgi:antitoxin component YwqK of YwqJK toxin-antitoxin module